MDGFTAFLTSPPPSRGSANDYLYPFMRRARCLSATIDRL